MLSRAEAKIKDTSYFREKRLWNFENMIKLMLINMRYLLVLSSMGILALMIGPRCVTLRPASRPKFCIL